MAESGGTTIGCWLDVLELPTDWDFISSREMEVLIKIGEEREGEKVEDFFKYLRSTVQSNREIRERTRKKCPHPGWLFASANHLPPSDPLSSSASSPLAQTDFVFFFHYIQRSSSLLSPQGSCLPLLSVL